MSDLLTMMYDMYEDYKLLCKKFNYNPKEIDNESWVVDMRDLETLDEIINRENE